MKWLRSIQLRVLAVVLVSALAAGAVAIRVAISVMTDLAEVSLVEETVERTDRARTAIADRLAVARAELTSAALLAEVDRTSAVATALSEFVRAARVERDGESLELVRTDDARRILTEADGKLEPVLIDGHVVVHVDVGGAIAVGVVDVSNLLPTGNARWAQVEPATDPRLGVAGVIVHRRRTAGGERAVALALIGDGLAVRHEVSLVGARAEIENEMLHVVGWGVAVTAVLVLVLAWTLSRRVTRPVRALAAAVRAGRSPMTLPRLQRDEIGELGNAIAAAHGALAHDAHLLTVSARFARDALRNPEPETIVEQLEAALTSAHPDHQWRVRTGDEAVADLKKVGMTQTGSWSRVGTEGVVTPMVIEIDGNLVVHGDTGGASSFVAVGRGSAGADDRRSIETLCRTAVAALKNFELARAATINDKLALIGKMSASIAHELNNPLAYVTLNLNLLEEELQGREREMVRDVLGGVQRVTRIVADLSRQSRGGRDTLAREDLIDVVAEQLRIARGRLGSVELVVQPSAPAWVRCGRGRIGQAALNLVVNAIDAAGARPGGRVEISFRRDGERWIVRIADNGPGIPASVQRHLFDAFFSTKGERGTGLGLYLSREFVRSQGGTLELVTTGDTGSVFELGLPADVDDVLPAAAEALAPGAVERPRVLVIDDEPIILRTVKRALAKYADVTTAARGEEALVAARSQRFALVLCDWNMPEMTGGEVLEELRKIAPETAARLVFMTGAGHVTTSGVKVLTKPVELSKIREMIDAA